jgi:5'-nucleotidase/UDP-sugar diphosphatase
LPELRKKADLIVVLSHLGLSGDMKLAQKVRGIDVIIGGHTHTKLLQPVTVGATIIAQAWEHGKALGVLDLTVKDGKVIKFHGYLQEIRPTGNADQKIENLVAKYSRKVDARLNKNIGKTEVDLDGEQVRTRETNLGDLIADIMREKSGAQVAIINGGGIRTSINKGVIRVRDVYSVLPFNNYLIAIRLTGRQLQEALEHGVSGLEEKAGRFPQVSGLSFTYDPRAPSGSRIKAVVVGGQPLAPDQDYVVATNDFLVVGGDGYKVFGEAIKAAGDYSDAGGILKSKNLVYNDPGTWLRDVVIDYIKARKKIGPRVEGRIKVSG